MQRNASLLAFALISLIASGAEAQDAPRGAVFGGFQAGGDESAYLGVFLPQPGAQVGRGWAARVVAAGGEYDYVSQGSRIEGSYRQAEAVLVYQRSGGWGYLNLGGGVRYTDTELSPVDPGNERDGGQADALVTVDGVRRAGPWAVGGFASYGIGMEEYFLRAETTYAIGDTGFEVGAEALAEGDPNYERQGVGAVVAFSDGDRWRVRASVGVREGDDRSDTYGALNFVRSF